MNVHPIKTKADYKRTLVEIERLWDAAPNTPAGDRLDILATLVSAYETKHYPIDSPDPIEAILFHMEQKGFTRRDLEPLMGSRARVSEVLNRKRPLTLAMIRQVSAALDIPAEVLIHPYPLQRDCA